MARKITTDAAHAFMIARENFKRDNTTVSLEPEFVVMRLHGNTIARRRIGSNAIQITNAGWMSNTTKERLNGIPGVSICQKKGQWFLNGNVWDGEWITV
jgi:hypothetical protein